MAQIGVNISFAGYTGHLVIVWKEAIQNNPNPPETGRSAAIAFDVDEVYVISNINPVVHIVEFWRSSDGGTTLDELLRSWSIDASRTSNNPVVAQFDYVVGRGTTEGTIGEGDYWADPANNDTQIVDERLNGYAKSEIRFEQRGGIKYREDEYDLVAGGGVELLGGFTFGEDGQTYSVTIYKTIEGSTTTVTQSSDYNDVVLVTANDDFDNTFYKKLIVANKAGSGLLTITFPDLLLITNTKVKFQTHQGNQDFLVLQLDAGDTIKFLGQSVNKIVLGKGEEIEIMFKDNVGYVMHYEGDARRVGQRILDDVQRLNTLKADGTEYNLADYPRVADYLNSLPVAQVKSYVDWASSTNANYVVDQDGSVQYQKTIYPHKGFFAKDAVNGKFKVPDMRNMFVRALKALDSVDASDTERTTNKPGAYQIDAFRKHNHEAGGLWNENHTGKFASGGNFNEGEFDVQEAGGTETRGENIGLIPLIVV
jgi:hypothetical protein